MSWCLVEAGVDIHHSIHVTQLFSIRENIKLKTEDYRLLKIALFSIRSRCTQPKHQLQNICGTCCVPHSFRKQLTELTISPLQNGQIHSL